MYINYQTNIFQITVNHPLKKQHHNYSDRDPEKISVRGGGNNFVTTQILFEKNHVMCFHCYGIIIVLPGTEGI